jgi:hypothetical protein
MAVTKTTTYDGLYTIDTYTGTGNTTWTVPAGVTSIESLVLAGGGSGGHGTTGGGGGGGAGGCLLSTQSVTPGSVISITVGAGGAVASTHGTKGANSVLGSITQIGGGYGGMGYAGTNQNGGPGGSGGGAGGVVGALGGEGDWHTGGDGFDGASAAGTINPLGGSGGGGQGTAGVSNDYNLLTGGASGTAAWEDINGTSTGYGKGGDGGNASPSSTYGATANNTGSPIGGGVGYLHIVSSGTFTVTTLSQFIAKMTGGSSPATSGQIVFIPGSVTLDLTGYGAFTIPAGVTLASDRGLSGSLGALIKRTDYSPGTRGTLYAGGNNVRITGIRLQGNTHEYGGLVTTVKCGIREIDRTGFEVDNCEIYDWSYAGVALENSTAGTWTANIHHNKFHHISSHDSESGYGYGIMAQFGDTLVEANEFDYMRHAVIGEGCSGEKIEMRYNTVGLYDVDGIIDLHRDCGGWTAGGVSGSTYNFHHNTSIFVDNVFLNMYGTPSVGLTVTKNDLKTGIHCRNGTTRVSMTDNIINGVITASGPIDTS